MTLVPRVLEGLRAEGLEDVLVIVGGIIPERDIEVMKQAGVSAVFTPGASLPQIASGSRRRWTPASGRARGPDRAATEGD